MPSYGLINMKYGNCESSIIYSSSIITYLKSCVSYLDNHEAISIPLQCYIEGYIFSKSFESKYSSLIVDGVISIILPGRFLTSHNSFIASNP